MLILLLLNLNADYADTDAELCIKIMSNYVIALYSIVVDYAIKLILHSNIILKILYFFLAQVCNGGIISLELKSLDDVIILI